MKVAITAEDIEQSNPTRDTLVFLVLEALGQEKARTGAAPLVVKVEFPREQGGVRFDIRTARWFDRLRFWRD